MNPSGSSIIPFNGKFDNFGELPMICQIKTIQIGTYNKCDCLSENLPSSHLPVFGEIPF